MYWKWEWSEYIGEKKPFLKRAEARRFWLRILALFRRDELLGVLREKVFWGVSEPEKCAFSLTGVLNEDAGALGKKGDSWAWGDWIIFFASIGANGDRWPEIDGDCWYWDDWIIFSASIGANGDCWLEIDWSWFLFRGVWEVGTCWSEEAETRFSISGETGWFSDA